MSGMMLESQGLYGKSKVFAFPYPALGSTPSVSPVFLPRGHFGEGITFLPGPSRLVGVTWKERVGTLYEVGPGGKSGFSLARGEDFQYETTTMEGWGLAHVEERAAIAVSDGSENIMFWDEGMMEERKGERIRVHIKLPDGTTEYIDRINELEYYQGDLLCNVWFREEILRVDASSGFVKAVYDFSDLWPPGERHHGADVFNGIAAMPDGDLVVTGKFWDRYYRVSLKDGDDDDDDIQ